MAVRPDRRNAGYGTRLLDDVLGTLRHEGVGVVEVKTLDPSASHVPYEATRSSGNIAASYRSTASTHFQAGSLVTLRRCMWLLSSPLRERD